MSESTERLERRMTDRVLPWLQAQDQTNEMIVMLNGLSERFSNETDPGIKERIFTAIRSIGATMDSWPVGRRPAFPAEVEMKLNADASRIADYFLELWNQDEDFRAVEKPHGRTGLDEYTSETYHATIKSRYLHRLQKEYRANQ